MGLEGRVGLVGMVGLVGLAGVLGPVARPDRFALRGQQVPVFRAGVDLVHVGITVTDRQGILVTGLQMGDFDLYEDGVKQTLQYFSAGDAPSGGRNPALHLGVLLDVSDSMADEVRFMRTAAIKFLNTLTEAVDVTVVDFDTEVRAARYGQAEFARLVERIRQQKTNGMTALYDAIGVYLDGASSQEGRKVMLLYTDGGDTRSALRLNELVDLLKASDVTVYAVGAVERQSASAGERARSILQRIADATGGRAFFPTSLEQLDRVYGTVVAEIRAQYTLGYVSTNGRGDGAWRRIELRTPGAKGRALKLRSRKGYYARYRKPPG